MPRKAAEDSVQIKFRIKDNVRVGLEAAAEERGTSLNQEIAERLSKSLEPKRHWETFDNHKVNAIVDLVSQVIYAAGHNAGGLSTGSIEGSFNWYDNAFAFDQVRKAVDVALGAIKPSGTLDLRDLAARLPSDREHVAKAMTKKDSIFHNIGESAAWGILAEIKMFETDNGVTLPPERISRAKRLQAGLGHIADRIPD